jgi:very-short-patch-repair endonuclease
VTVPRLGARTRPEIRVHRPRILRADEVTVHHSIPVTTPGRTVLDLAATLSERALERALDHAEIQPLTDYPALNAIARAHPGHRGARKLTEMLRRHHAGTTLTRSELEERFLELCRHSGVPRPRVNAWVAGLEVDFVFAEARVAVETDSRRHHHTRQAFERDRHRDATLTRAGYRTLRFTHDQIASTPDEVAATVAAALADRRVA